MKEWNIVTFKNGKRKDHHATSNDEATCQDVATWFDIIHNGDEGDRNNTYRTVKQHCFIVLEDWISKCVFL